jgi:hypothetical protein
VNPLTRRYVFAGGIDQVEGWLGSGAVTATLAINYFQKSTNVCGNIAEIGVHHGKYFIVLKNLCGSAEFAIAVDVFEDQHLNIDGSGLGDRAKFEDYISHFSNHSNLIILKRDSISLNVEDIISAGDGSRVRLFSIDGSHTTAHTCSDLMIAAEALATGGVIILDDLYNPYWPGVQEGFHRFMELKHTEFCVFCIGDNKAYLCRKNDHESFLSFFEELRPFSTEYKKVVIWDTDALLMSFHPPEIVFSSDYKIPRNTFFFGGSALPNRCRLISGWGSPEGDGVWTTGEQSSLELTLVDLPRSGRLNLRMDVIPFLHSQRASRCIHIFVNESLAASLKLTSIVWENIVLTIDAGLLRNETSLTLKIENPERPRDFLASEDSRQVGVKLRLISLEMNGR